MRVRHGVLLELEKSEMSDIRHQLEDSVKELDSVKEELDSAKVLLTHQQVCNHLNVFFVCNALNAISLAYLRHHYSLLESQAEPM